MNFPLSDEQLIFLSKRGLLAGPEESTEDFSRRIENSPPLSQEANFSTIQSLYKIKPDWVKLIYRNEQLSPWEGGCCLEEEETITIHLRRSLDKKKRLFGFYNKQELIDHEWVHATRGRFDEPLFEEILAYQTAHTLFRQKVGPIIRTPKESLVYMLSLLGVILSIAWLPLLPYALGVNLLLLCYGVGRLFYLLKKFALAKQKCGQVIGSSKEALSFLLHLKDEEILTFAALTPAQIQDYFQKNRQQGVRFRQIYARFFMHF